MHGYYKLAVYAAKSESVVKTLAEELLIAEAEFVIDDFFTSAAKLELNLTSQGITDTVMICSISSIVAAHAKFKIVVGHRSFSNQN